MASVRRSLGGGGQPDFDGCFAIGGTGVPASARSALAGPPKPGEGVPPVAAYASTTHLWLQQSWPCIRVFVRIIRIFGLNAVVAAKSGWQMQA